MTTIIGHRGAAGVALENSLQSVKAAIRHGVDALEFDVHLTKDGHIVVLHDKRTRRIADEDVIVRQKTLAELRALELKNGQTIPTIDEVLATVGTTPLVIDIKDHGVAEAMIEVFKRFPKAHVTFASFKHQELARAKELFPECPIYVLEHHSPFEIINRARHLKATGIGLNKWLMNPLTYKLARRYHLELYVYTVNSPLLVKFLLKFYPEISLCTDHPARFSHLRKKK